MAEEEEATTAVDEDESNVETSLEELLQRKERRIDAGDDDDDEEALIEAIDEREGPGGETLTVKVLPPQPTEFTCRSCFLLKHQNQLKDRKRMLCRDCA